MTLPRMLALLPEVGVAFIVIWLGTRIWLRSHRSRDSELRREIETHQVLATPVAHASLLMAAQFGGSHWTAMQSPRRLIVGTGGLIFSAPNALKEWALRGPDCSIARSREPSHLVQRDWIVITTRVSGRPLQFAISDDKLPEIWDALTAAGVAYGHVPAA